MDKEQVECDIIKQLLIQYFQIVRKNISDSVPKSIMCFLVNKSKSSLQSELVRKMYKEDLFKDLLKENDDIAQKRKATQKMLSVLQKAQSIINEIKDISV
jgi:replication fork clamp-binding protein CrfC